MPNGDRSIAMEAFRERALQRSPIPVPGVPQTPGGPPRQPVLPGGRQPGLAGGSQPAQAGNGQPREEINILKQVAGEITKVEMMETLIQRLKDLISKEEEQSEPRNVRP